MKIPTIILNSRFNYFYENENYQKIPIIVNYPLNTNNFSISTVLGDGNCLYRSISNLLLGSQELFNELKQYLILYICENYNLVKTFTKIIIFNHYKIAIFMISF
jgi:hypothetical protein